MKIQLPLRGYHLEYFGGVNFRVHACFRDKRRHDINYAKKLHEQGSCGKQIYDATLAKTQCGIINSEVIMRKVIDDLNLNEAWGNKYGVGTFKTWETLKFFNGVTSIRPIPDTTLIEISVFDSNPDDAATIATGIAKAYTSYTATNSGDLLAQIVDSASAGKYPIRPNKPFNYVLGAFTGIFLGFLAGVGVALFVFLKRRKASQISER